MVGPAAGPGVAFADELEVDRRVEVAAQQAEEADIGAHPQAVRPAQLPVAPERRQQALTRRRSL